MERGNLDDLLALLAVGRERSFTKAAAKLSMSQSSLSHTIAHVSKWAWRRTLAYLLATRAALHWTC
jgi:hypothetical protein